MDLKIQVLKSKEDNLMVCGEDKDYKEAQVAS